MPQQGICSLSGRVKVETNSARADYKVYVSKNGFSDLKIKRVLSFPDRPGQWKFVDSFPDFRVSFVSHRGESDFSIIYVDSFPGC